MEPPVRLRREVGVQSGLAVLVNLLSGGHQGLA